MLGFFLYLPLFYFMVELIDRYTPNPVTYDVGKEDSSSDFSSPSEGSDDFKF